MPLRSGQMSRREGHVPDQRSTLATAILLMTLVQSAAAQEAATQPDSARAEIVTVLRAFYLNLANQNWDALSAYVLSPKLLERRGEPGGPPMGARGRTRGRGAGPPGGAPPRGPSRGPPPLT